MCYLSLGPKRTWNADADAYFENIRKQAHGSILEHANISLAFWGIPRSLTHELVRHRAGFAYSQVSQRYVDGTRLRFVMRPEFIGHPELEQHFVSWVDDVVVEYDKRAELLLKVMGPTLAKLTPTERRKAVNQAARSCLPNETEAPIVVTGNVRAWRHYLNMRGSQAAEPEIRALAVRVLVCLYQISPMLFQDFSIQKDDTGRIFLHTAYPKV
jgi:thymidylate synthase (FAD)